MNIVIFGSGMMGRAIAFDLSIFSKFNNISIADKNIESLRNTSEFLNNKNIDYIEVDVENSLKTENLLKNFDIAISAIPYQYNFKLANIAIECQTHFLDLGGNNEIVKKQKKLFTNAKNNDVIIIPDCGLAPGMVSTIVREIVDYMDNVNYVKIRVGGLPIKPRPPLNYQIVFSPNGLINEYIEKAIVLDHGKIVIKKSMTEIEEVYFPDPFDNMEAFLTSGGCSTLPYTFRNKIKYLDYKTIRYPGHCEKFKLLLDLGLGDTKPIKINNQKIIPRDILIQLLKNTLPLNERDVVLIKVMSNGIKANNEISMEYTIIDYYDEKNNITSMMRTTAYPVSIIAQMIEQKIISKRGVYCPEEIVPCKKFFNELNKRNINIEREIKSVK